MARESTRVPLPGPNNKFSNGGGDVAIVFAPNGRIEHVYIAGDPNSPYSVVQPIFLLVGKRERAGNIFTQPVLSPRRSWDTALTNYEDITNLWVMINPQTGLITGAEMGVDADAASPRTPPMLGLRSPAKLDVAAAAAANAARVLARDSQGMGGK